MIGGTMYGQATDIGIAAKQILRTRQQMNEILAQRTGQSLEKIEKDTDRDYYMSAQEAMEYGLIDRVIEEKPS
jgi:ATP-dependent Clp protease protease subunit